MISTHAPAGGATVDRRSSVRRCSLISTHAPAGGATDCCHDLTNIEAISTHAPAGGATLIAAAASGSSLFLLTPLREGRRCGKKQEARRNRFLLTPLREGRRKLCYSPAVFLDFYSRPCGRGDCTGGWRTAYCRDISTHAPAGGATAIFHKSVMRFCGKLPKDDTVLCLASFGFPRRDPKAVYLAWISCANLPQKCVREGLALKDQGTSCFHEGLASHAFDPVLV